MRSEENIIVGLQGTKEVSDRVKRNNNMNEPHDAYEMTANLLLFIERSKLTHQLPVHMNYLYWYYY